MGFFRFHALLPALALALTASSCLQTAEVVQKKTMSTAKTGGGLLEVRPQTVDNNVAPADASGVSKVAAGYQHVCALTSGKLRCWGLNRNGQIGNGDSGVIPGVKDPMTGAADTVKTVLSPYTVFESGVTDVAVGYEHTCAIHENTLKCWGSNEFGQAGLGTAKESVKPVEVLKDVVQISVRGRLSCAVTKTAKLFCFGTRLAHHNGVLEPKLISKTPKELISEKVTRINVSPTHACVTVDSALRCWGLNAAGEIGNGDTTGKDVDTPYEVFASQVSQVSLTDGRSCAVVQGVMKCFGVSLGDRKIDAGDGGSWKTPEYRPYDAYFWNGIAPGTKMSASGTILVESGDLYYGSYFHVNGVPAIIATGVIDFQFSEAELVGCMMYRNRQMKCWGSNTFGQLGTGVRSGDEPLITKAVNVVGL